MKLNRVFFVAAVAALWVAPLQAGAHQAYPTPDATAQALVDALAAMMFQALGTVLGNDWRRYIPEDGAEREDVYTFLSAWSQRHSVKKSVDSAHLVVGSEDWEFPVPIVQSGSGWHFDLRRGEDEIRTRRIGRNELDAMQAALAYVDAQRDYALAARRGDGVLQYAQRFISLPGKRDGLYWPVKQGEAESPLGPLFAGDIPGGEGYHGYRFKILKAQGKSAPGGAYDYVIKGRMVSGFALVAWPDRYGETGVTTFLISHDGVLYEKDLGPSSAALAQQMRSFDPGDGWRKVGPAVEKRVDNKVERIRAVYFF